MASGPITSWEIVGKQWKQWQTLFWGAPKSLQMVTRDDALFLLIHSVVSDSLQPHGLQHAYGRTDLGILVTLSRKLDCELRGLVLN